MKRVILRCWRVRERRRPGDIGSRSWLWTSGGGWRRTRIIDSRVNIIIRAAAHDDIGSGGLTTIERRESISSYAVAALMILAKAKNNCQ